MIQLAHATLEFTDDGAVTKFSDGSRYGALPHDEPHYHAIAHRLGYEGDILRYCQEHELAHHLIAEYFDRTPVMWALAYGGRPDAFATAAEEALAMALQRYLHTNEVPLIDRVDWDGLRERMKEKLEAA